MTELEGSLRAKKQYKVIFDSVEEKAHRVEKYRKDTESLKAFQDEGVGLRRAFSPVDYAGCAQSPKMSCGAKKEVLP